MSDTVSQLPPIFVANLFSEISQRLIQLLRSLTLADWQLPTTSCDLAKFFASLDPFAPAIFPVAWAGEQESFNWMDVARDYTEKMAPYSTDI